MAPSLKFALGTAAVAASIFGAVQTSPVFPRQKANIVKDLLKLIGVFTDSKDVNAWDYNTNNGMCEVYMETRDGGNCYATVTCKDSGERKYTEWNVCYVGGQQFFTDDRIGDFSITFTQKDGTEGEGLTDPILRLKNIENFRDIPVSSLAQEKLQSEECEKGIAPIDCFDGPFVCDYYESGNKYIYDDRTKRYHCGVPRVDAQLPDGLGWEDIFNEGE